MKAVRVGAVAVVLGLLGLLVWDVAHQGHVGGVAGKVDKGNVVAAPPLTLPTLGGGRFDLAAYRGKVVILNFWASWCVECKLEARTLHDVQKRWGGRAVVIGVDTKDLSFAAKRYMRRYAVNYPVVRDVDGSEGDRWGVTGYPETFFVDRNGHVIPPHLNGPIIGAKRIATMNTTISQALTS
jgi:cytochrome c biogenesis protein CcmG/thiol:disulfide interchange protein DsbE